MALISLTCVSWYNDINQVYYNKCYLIISIEAEGHSREATDNIPSKSYVWLSRKSYFKVFFIRLPGDLVLYWIKVALVIFEEDIIKINQVKFHFNWVRGIREVIF